MSPEALTQQEAKDLLRKNNVVIDVDDGRSEQEIAAALGYITILPRIKSEK